MSHIDTHNISQAKFERVSNLSGYAGFLIRIALYQVISPISVICSGYFSCLIWYSWIGLFAISITLMKIKMAFHYNVTTDFFIPFSWILLPTCHSPLISIIPDLQNHRRFITKYIWISFIAAAGWKGFEICRRLDPGSLFLRNKSYWNLDGYR